MIAHSNLEERRYFATPLSWLTHEGSTLALSKVEPRWALLNQTAAWIVRFCESKEGSTLLQLGQCFRDRFGAVSEEQLSQWLADIEANGLIASGTERPSFRASPSPSYESYHIEHVYIELLARCNLRCIHCFMEGSPDREESLDPEEVVAVLEALQQAGGHYVTLAGGEPLLYRYFEDIARKVAQLELYGTVISNGVLLREKHLKLLDELGFNLAISLDGIKPEVNEAIRGRKTYTAIMETIDRSLEVLGADRFILSFTPVKANLEDLSALFDFAETKGIRRINLSLMEEVGRATAHYEQLHLTEVDRIEIASIVYRKALELMGKIEIDFNDTRNILSRFSSSQQPDELHPLWKGVRLSSQGDVYPSSFGSAQEYCLGNIREIAFSQILQSEKLRKLYETLSKRFHKIPQCKSCNWQQICRGGSVTSAYYSTGNLLSPDSYCSGYLKMFPEVAISLAQILK